MGVTIQITCGWLGTTMTLKNNTAILIGIVMRVERGCNEI